MFGIIHVGFTLLASSSGKKSGGLGLLFLLSGFAFYAYVFMRYRNADKRYHYETKTETTKLNMQKQDDLVESRTNLSNSRMHGANNTEVDGAGGFPTSMGQIMGMTGQLGSIVKQAAQQAQQHGGSPAPGTTPIVPLGAEGAAPTPVPSPPPPPPGGVMPPPPPPGGSGPVPGSEGQGQGQGQAF